MNNPNAKVIKTLVAFSSAALLTAFTDEHDVHAEIMDTDSVITEEQDTNRLKEEKQQLDEEKTEKEKVETDSESQNVPSESQNVNSEGQSVDSDSEDSESQDTDTEDEQTNEEEASENIFLEVPPIHEKQEIIKGKSIPNVLITISSEEIIGETRTDEEGAFEVDIAPAAIDSYFTISVLSDDREVLFSQDFIVSIEDVDEEENAFIIEPYDLERKEINGLGVPEYSIQLKNEKDVVVGETIVDENGLFTIKVPSDIAFKKLFIEYFNIETEIYEKLAVKGVPEQEEKTESEDKVTDSIEKEENVIDKKPEVQKAPPKKAETLAAVQKSTEKAGKTYYYVQSGDNLNSIAKHYGVTANQLIKWNSIKNPNSIYVGQLLSIDGTNVYDQINKENKRFSSSKEFIEYLASSAVKVAEKNNLYTSVMIAQAALESGYGESGLAKIGNNLFGIKGSYKGNSIVMRTWEETKDGEVIWINDYFRLYPSFYESLLDNADKLRNGVSWDKNFYKGTWVENTKSYKDATAWLTGRYATDSSYGSKLNGIIDYWNLTQYDKHVNKFDKVISSRNTNYQAKITGSGHPLATSPVGTEGSKTVSSSNNYIGKTFKITKEMVTESGTFVQMKIGNQNLWMNKAGIQAENMSNTVNVNYQAVISRGGDSLNTLPWGVDGFQTVGYTNSLVGQTVYVIQETTTPRAKWAKIKVNGQQLWVDITALSPETMTNTVNVNYQAKITRKGDTLNTLPWGIKGFQTVAKTDSYIGQTVYVLQETTTPRAKWAKIKVNGQQLWVDITALSPETMTNTKTVSYDAKITRSGDTITSLPWGVKGFVVNASSSSYLNKEVKVVEETTTPRATWAKIQVNGKVLGWIDKKALNTKGCETILSSRQTDYQAKIIEKGHTLDTSPWGTRGFQTVGNSSNYYGKTVKVEEVAETSRGSWAKFKLNGKHVWMDIKGLQAEKMTNTVNKNYEATIKRSGDTISSLPWGIEGYQVTGYTNPYIGKKIKVLKETTTPRATWVYISINGKELGWIDKKAISI